MLVPRVFIAMLCLVSVVQCAKPDGRTPSQPNDWPAVASWEDLDRALTSAIAETFNTPNTRAELIKRLNHLPSSAQIAISQKCVESPVFGLAAYLLSAREGGDAPLRTAVLVLARSNPASPLYAMLNEEVDRSSSVSKSKIPDWLAQDQLVTFEGASVVLEAISAGKALEYLVVSRDHLGKSNPAAIAALILRASQEHRFDEFPLAVKDYLDSLRFVPDYGVMTFLLLVPDISVHTELLVAHMNADHPKSWPSYLVYARRSEILALYSSLIPLLNEQGKARVERIRGN